MINEIHWACKHIKNVIQYSFYQYEILAPVFPAFLRFSPIVIVWGKRGSYYQRRTRKMIFANSKHTRHTNIICRCICIVLQIRQERWEMIMILITSHRGTKNTHRQILFAHFSAGSEWERIAQFKFCCYTLVLLLALRKGGAGVIIQHFSELISRLVLGHLSSQSLSMGSS